MDDNDEHTIWLAVFEDIMFIKTLVQGGLEIPCLLAIKGKKKDLSKLKTLIAQVH